MKFRLYLAIRIVNFSELFHLEQLILITNGGIQVGGKGGVLINDKIALGGVGNAYFNYTYKGAKDLSASDYRLIMGAGGIFVEYLVRRENAVHLSFPLNFLIGGARIKGRNDRETLERSIFFAFEPGISLEFNATPYFIPSINLVSFKRINHLPSCPLALPIGQIPQR